MSASVSESSALILIKEHQGKIGASSISPGAFAMMMGVHVRCRSQTDPPLNSENFISEPLSGPCKPESIMIIEYYCLMNDYPEKKEDIVKLYNNAVYQYFKEKGELRQGVYSRWNEYPEEYSESVRQRYIQTLSVYDKCSEILQSDSATIVFLNPIYRMLKYLDLYGYLGPGLFLAMLGIHARHKNNSCKSTQLMAMELIVLIKFAHHSPNYQEALDAYNEHLLQNAETEGFSTETLTSVYAINVVKFLERIRFEYRDCKESKEPEEDLDPRFHGKIFVCDTPEDSKVNPTDPDVNPADIQELCDSRLCLDTDPLTIETLKPDAVQLLVGGKPICYNRESIQKRLETTLAEPNTKIKFSQEQAEYFGVAPDKFRRIYQTEYSHEHERERNIILGVMHDLVKNYIQENFGINVDTIIDFLPDQPVDLFMQRESLDYLKTPPDEILEHAYNDRQVWTPVQYYNRDSRAFIDAFMNQNESDLSLRNPQHYGYILKPGDRDYVPPEPVAMLPPRASTTTSSSSITVWDASNIPTDENTDWKLEREYRKTLNKDELIDRILRFYISDLMGYANRHNIEYNPSPTDIADFRSILVYMYDQEHLILKLKRTKAEQLFIYALVDSPMHTEYYRNMITNQETRNLAITYADDLQEE